MPRVPAKPNRGPAAARENRDAILAAAREVFGERGYDAPLSAVAQRAGVGQGVLYRHFPSRLDLAFAAFESHWHEFEELAAADSPDAVLQMWQRLIELAIFERAFIEMFVDQRRQHADYDGGTRMQALLSAPLERAIAAGRVDASLTTEDLLLGVAMAYGVVVTTVDADGLVDTVARALARAGLLPPAAGESDGRRA
ncbi:MULTISPECIES: TetR/AcrR family transcriptional regulator [Nocardioides]|uniref:TetR/AcrR family transcriptional regulator n=1 Tax=Nocardioides TaxID=1839 RepID=UPI0028682810|nr:helix-turn-helix domain-containing protein [Nocardioides sp. CGMCC 1.13656]